MRKTSGIYGKCKVLHFDGSNLRNDRSYALSKPFLNTAHRGGSRIRDWGHMASTECVIGITPYNGGLGAVPPAGSRGRAPGQGVRGAKPP